MEHDQGTERLGPEPECALVQDLLPLYMEGEVRPQSRMLIVAHLNDCAHCAGFLAGAQSVRAQFQQAKHADLDEPPSGFSFKIDMLAGILAVLVALIALAAVIAIGSIIGIQALLSPRNWMLMLADGQSLHPYLLLGLATLGANAVALLRCETRQSVLWFAASLFAVMFVVLRLLLVMNGALGVWYRNAAFARILPPIRAFAVRCRR